MFVVWLLNSIFIHCNMSIYLVSSWPHPKKCERLVLVFHWDNIAGHFNISIYLDATTVKFMARAIRNGFEDNNCSFHITFNPSLRGFGVRFLSMTLVCFAYPPAGLLWKLKTGHKRKDAREYSGAASCLGHDGKWSVRDAWTDDRRPSPLQEAPTLLTRGDWESFWARPSARIIAT